MAAVVAGPSDNISPSELYIRCSEAKREFTLVDFPRNDPTTGLSMGQVAIWPLRQGEIIAAKAEATRYARLCIKEKFEHAERIEGYAQVFEDACATELAWRFCRRPENPLLPVFPTAAKVREQLTGDELAVLVDAYAIIQHERGPIVSTMTDQDFEAWIKRLEEGGSAVPLASLSWERRNALTMHLVSLLATLRTDTSSPGSPPEDLTITDVT